MKNLFITPLAPCTAFSVVKRFAAQTEVCGKLEEDGDANAWRRERTRSVRLKPSFQTCVLSRKFKSQFKESIIMKYAETLVCFLSRVLVGSRRSALRVSAARAGNRGGSVPTALISKHGWLLSCL